MKEFDTILVWFRRDLRMADQTALAQARVRARRVYCAFVFDTEILDRLPSRADRRVEFIWRSLAELDDALRQSGGGMVVVHGRARDEIPRLALELGADAVFANRDYEPAACERDDAVAAGLHLAGLSFVLFKDQVVFERDEIMTRQGAAYTVFTPYKNAWLKKLDAADVTPRRAQAGAGELAVPAAAALPSLESLGFAATDLRDAQVPTGMSGAERLLQDFLGRIDSYHERRNYPSLKGPSYLSVHLRFGTTSIRRLVGEARLRSGPGPQVWLSELIWREFYFQLLSHFPRVATHAFRTAFEAVEFDNDPAMLQAWSAGRTGYPLVDAGMRQLNRSGYMHNRLRMVTASFLVKDLHVDWRRGERVFADRLIDFDLAANNGGWQWAASTGCDAQPYFRVFNPVTQSERFDPDGAFIRRYVPELARVPTAHIHAPWRMTPLEQEAAGCVIGRDYPPPIVDHDQARALTLARFGRAKDRAAAAG